MRVKACYSFLLFLVLLLPVIGFAQNVSVNEDLIAAVKKGDLEAVKSLIAKGANVNVRTNYGATALHFAADRGHLEIIKALVEAGADVNARDEFYKSTPTMMAMMRQHKEVIVYLQQAASANKEVPQPSPKAPAAQAATSQPAAKTADPALNEELLTAARKSDLAAVKALLARGADVNAKSPYGATPLFFACDRGSLEIVKTLVESGADVNVKDTFYNSTAIGWAVSKNHIAIVKLLLEKGANSKQTVMRSAINEEKTDIIRMLLEMGGFKPEEMTDFLTLAERNKKAEIAEILKRAGAQPKPKVEYKVEPEKLKSYEGRFKAEQFEMIVKIKDGKLTCSIEQSFESALNPVGEHAFDVEQTGGVIITFIVEENKVTGLRWKTPTRELVLKKLEAK